MQIASPIFLGAFNQNHCSSLFSEEHSDEIRGNISIL